MKMGLFLNQPRFSRLECYTENPLGGVEFQRRERTFFCNPTGTPQKDHAGVLTHMF
jgi:hypothetical protein